MMDKAILEKVNKVVDLLQHDNKLRLQFTQEPVRTIERILGVDLPDDLIQKIAEAVKANLAADDIGDMVNLAMKIFKK